MDTQPKILFIRKFLWLVIIVLFIVSIGLLIFAVVRNNGRISNSLNANISIKNTNTQTSVEKDLISRKRSQIEAAYPEFKNFENQKSFAGQTVIYLVDGNDHYFAYNILGSGLPIAQATCFRVDRMMRVYKIGEFPDPLDSFAGYREVNPKNCTGIK